MTENKSVIILGANSDIAKYVAINFYKKNYKLTFCLEILIKLDHF